MKLPPLGFDRQHKVEQLADSAALPEKREPGGKARRYTADDRRAALKRVAKRRAKKGYR